MQHDDHAPSRPLSYTDELAMAQQLLEQGDLIHALHHCLGALALEPLRSEWQPLLRRLLVRDGLLGKLEEDSYFAAKAALAWHMHEQGDLIDGLDLIGAVAVAVPHLGFQQWFGAWLEEAAARDLGIDPGTVLRVLLLGTSFGIGRIKLLPTEQAAARDLAPIARFAAATLQDPQVYMLASAVLRRAGENADAIEMAERARGAGGDLAQVATVVGLALRAAGDPGRALEIFDGAYELSHDVIYLQEKFRALADAGRWQEAHDLGEVITSSKPADGESQLEYAFVAHALRNKLPKPSSPPLDDIRRRSLGHGVLWTMTDATANLLRTMADKGSSLMQTAVSGHEGPSNRLCLAMMFNDSIDPRRAAYSNPDVLHELDTSEYSLWRLDGDVAVQALPAPPSSVLDWVERLCASPAEDFLDLWEVSAITPRPRCTSADWIAATVYPRLRPSRSERNPDWLFRWQTCALLGLAHSGDRAALLAMLRGAIDWPLAAAIRVAAEVALRDPGAARELRQALIDLVQPLQHVPNAGIPTALLISLEMLPYVGKTYLDTLREALETRERDNN